jgi:2,4-dienoyl-CoA reductase (NADPH2)
MSASAYPLLFAEWKLRKTRIPNRLVFAPTCPTWVANPVEGVFTDQAVAYYEERAAAGVGLIVIGANMVDRKGLYAHLNFPGLWDDRQIEGLARVREACHRHGCKVAVQLLHAGLRNMAVIQKDPAYDLDAEWFTVAPSQVPPGEWPNAPMPKELEEHEIVALVQAFGEATRRAREAGLDGVELHGANGYLITQFLSSAINDRKDEYGGSLENRARFVLDVVRAIRQRVGSDFHLQMKISAVEHADAVSFFGIGPAGNTLDDSVRVCQWLVEAGVDAIHVSTGAFFPHPCNPAGSDLPVEDLVKTYDTMISSGDLGFRNYVLFRTAPDIARHQWQSTVPAVGSPLSEVASGPTIGDGKVAMTVRSSSSSKRSRAFLGRLVTGRRFLSP